MIVFRVGINLNLWYNLIMKKIAIIGVTASGKTTLANKLGTMLNIPVYHLDKIAWKDNGVFASQAEIIEKVSEILNKSSWIIDGSMHRSKTLEMRIKEADTIISYNLPFYINLWRQTKRFFKYYNKVRPDMGGNNKQKYPFTWKDIKYNINYSKEEMHSKMEPYLNKKKIIIIKNIRDESLVFKNLGIN